MTTQPAIDRTGFDCLYPFKSHYLDINGLAYHYLDEGEGQPVLMLHGNPTWSFYFRSLVQALSPRCRCLVPDHIGCGLSARPSEGEYGYRLQNRVEDLAAFLDHISLTEKLTLIVHDWGGAIGLAYAVDHPEKIGRLIITNTAAFLPPGNKKIPLCLALIRNFSLLAEPAVLRFNVFVRGALSMAPCRRLSPEVKKGLTAPYNSPPNRLATLKFVQDIPLRKGDPSYELIKYVDDHLHRLAQIPKLVCWGEKDFVFDRDYLAEWQRRCPEAEVHAFPDAGHYLLEDKPDQTARLISDFLDRYPLTLRRRIEHTR